MDLPPPSLRRGLWGGELSLKLNRGNFHRNPAEAPAFKQAGASLSESWCPKGEPNGSGQLPAELAAEPPGLPLPPELRWIVVGFSRRWVGRLFWCGFFCADVT